MKEIRKEDKRDFCLEINSLSDELKKIFEEKKQLETKNDSIANKLDYDLNIETCNLNKESKTILSIVID